MNFAGNGVLLLVAGFGGLMIYKKYADDRSLQDHSTHHLNPVNNRNTKQNNSLLGGGIRALPTEQNFRPNPLLSQPAYTPNPKPIAPKYRMRLMEERKMLQSDVPSVVNTMRVNSNYLTFAGDTGMANSRFFMAAAKAQAGMHVRKWRPGL